MVRNIGSSAQEYLVSNSGITIDNIQNTIEKAGINTENVQDTVAKSKQVVSDNFESSYAGKAVSGNMSDPTAIRNTILLLPPLAMANKFLDDKIAGAGSKGLLAKVSKFGDWISNKFNLNGFFSKETNSRVTNFLSNNRFTKYFTNKYKAIPKSSFAKGTTLTEKYAQELTGVIQKIASSQDISQLNLTPETMSILTDIATNGANASKLSTDKLINVADDLVAKGITTVSEKGIIPKNTSIAGLSNKLKTASMQMGETGLGQIFAKGFLKAKDVITFGGGLMGLAFTANAFVQAAKAAKEAPKGEKKATFMHVLSENYVGLLLFQPSVNLLYKAGGNKYRGMSVDARNALKDLITNTNATQNLSKEAYKIAQMQKKLLLKGVDKSEVAKLGGKTLAEAKTLFSSLKNQGAKLKFWEKPLKAAGNILTVGLDSIKKPSTSKLGKVTGKLKGFLGGASRFFIILLVLQPLLQKPVTKLFHKLFGEPKAYLAKQKAETEKDVVAENNTINDDNTNMLVGANSATTTSNQSGTNLLEKLLPKKAVSNPKADSVVVPNDITIPAQSVAPQVAQEPISAFGLFDREDKRDDGSYQGYIPSIDVDNSYANKKEKELEKYVDDFIAKKDKEIAKMSKN